MTHRRFGLGVQFVAAVSMIASGPATSSPFSEATSRMLYVINLPAKH
jgi:hypothetical protein